MSIITMLSIIIDLYLMRNLRGLATSLLVLSIYYHNVEHHNRSLFNEKSLWSWLPLYLSYHGIVSLIICNSWLIKLQYSLLITYTLETITFVSGLFCGIWASTSHRQTWTHKLYQIHYGMGRIQTSKLYKWWRALEVTPTTIWSQPWWLQFFAK
jgi:hypothetical protein